MNVNDYEILEGACLTLEQLAGAGALEQEWLVRRVEAGLVPVEGEAAGTRSNWRFTVATLSRARRMHEIERIYEADPVLAALVADLQEELEKLRRELRGPARVV